MTKQECKNFMERVGKYYPNKFFVDAVKINSWYEVLQNYSFEDLNNKLEKHMQSEEHKDKVPSLEFLIKFLTPTNVKIEDYAIECRKCHKTFNGRKEYNAHYMRCIQIHTMVRDLNKYYKMNLTVDSFNDLSDEKITEAYERYINKMLSLEEGLTDERRSILEKCR